MKFKNAFNCKKCPENANERGCPCWIEIVWENSDTNEKRVDKGCYFQMMPRLMLETVKATNISSQHASEMKNGFLKLADIAKKRSLLKIDK